MNFSSWNRPFEIVNKQEKESNMEMNENTNTLTHARTAKHVISQSLFLCSAYLLKVVVLGWGKTRKKLYDMQQISEVNTDGLLVWLEADSREWGNISFLVSSLKFLLCFWRTNSREVKLNHSFKMRMPSIFDRFYCNISSL